MINWRKFWRAAGSLALMVLVMTGFLALGAFVMMSCGPLWGMALIMGGIVIAGAVAIAWEPKRNI